MKALARPGVARVPGGRATPADRKIENDDEWDPVLISLGFVLCRPCNEWHRPPECWIDETGTPALDLILNE